MEQVINTLTEQRVRLDALKEGLIQLPNSRGKSLSYTALEKGRMYLGEVCRELGKAYPYEKTKEAVDAKGIQDAVDTSTIEWKIVGNEVVDLNKFREELEQEEVYFLDFIETFNASKGIKELSKIDKFKLDCNISEAWRGLKEARMWLGIRLGEIRDNAKK